MPLEGIYLWAADAEYEVLCRWPSSTIMNRLREQTGEMMGQREGKKVEKLPFELDLIFW